MTPEITAIPMIPAKRQSLYFMVLLYHHKDDTQKGRAADMVKVEKAVKDKTVFLQRSEIGRPIQRIAARIGQEFLFQHLLFIHGLICLPNKIIYGAGRA